MALVFVTELLPGGEGVRLRPNIFKVCCVKGVPRIRVGQQNKSPNEFLLSAALASSISSNTKISESNVQLIHVGDFQVLNVSTGGSELKMPASVFHLFVNYS